MLATPHIEPCMLAGNRWVVQPQIAGRIAPDSHAVAASQGEHRHRRWGWLPDTYSLIDESDGIAPPVADAKGIAIGQGLLLDALSLEDQPVGAVQVNDLISRALTLQLCVVARDPIEGQHDVVVSQPADAEDIFVQLSADQGSSQPGCDQPGVCQTSGALCGWDTRLASATVATEGSIWPGEWLVARCTQSHCHDHPLPRKP